MKGKTSDWQHCAANVFFFQILALARACLGCEQDVKTVFRAVFAHAVFLYTKTQST